MLFYLVIPAIFLISLSRILYNVFRPDLAWVPGPFYVRFTHLWRFIQMYRAKLPDDTVELHRKYGKIVRLGPDMVSVADPDMVDKIYGHRQDFDKVGD
jgi:hypothetical protein